MDVLCSWREEMETLRSSEQKAAGAKVWWQELVAKVLPRGLGTAVCRDVLKSISQKAACPSRFGIKE